MSNSRENHELDLVGHQPFEGSHDFEPRGQEAEALPPVDGGRHAWLFLAVCFLLEAVVWGFPYAFGVFQEHYASAGHFSDDSKGIAAIGTTATGIVYFASPLVIGFTGTFPHLVRHFSAIGLSLMLLGIVSASYATSVWQLILTQGVLYGIGGSLLYLPAIVYLDEWFVRRKGLAFGIMWAGTGTGGMLIPLLMTWFLEDYGFRTALRVWAIISAILLFPTLFLLKGRLPVQRPGAGVNLRRRIDLSFCKTGMFIVLQTGNIIQGLGYFIPSIYLPSYAKAIGLSNEASSLTISLVNAAAVVGNIGIGALVDRVEIHMAIMISSIGATVACLLVWGLSTSLAPLYIFAIMYGGFAGGYSATWPGITLAIRERCRDENGVSRVDTGMVVALFAAGKGIGAVVSGPLSEVLLEADELRGKAGGAFGTGYGSLVAWSGVTMFFGGISWFAKTLGKI
ncbi:MFS general substrate transporter [Bimuria novae-zelandiae CBS 107.79]|uniref:MFS general substrate transporter n=1 Tax=Bimuria novae-zelandiae CBS 107.79 TaxID=1447943 RepID=A0A6A5VPJ9_9PLEO|nr:MFS general substrate transporter [Bimuria novae-zelandiae CBS 107.79]